MLVNNLHFCFHILSKILHIADDVGHKIKGNVSTENEKEWFKKVTEKTYFIYQ